MINFSKNRILEIGTCALVFLFVWQARWIIAAGKINGAGNEYLTISLYAINALLVTLLLLKFFLIKKKTTFSGLFGNANNVAVFFLTSFVVWNGISIFWAANKLLALQHFAWLLLAMGLAWLLINCQNKFELIAWFLVGLSVSAWLGIFQFVAQFSYSNKWLGLSQHNPGLPGASIVEFYAGSETIRWLRSYGSFDHPNIFGVMMAIGIILTLWLLLEKEGGKNEKRLLNIALLVFAVGIFTSLSRSAWLGLFLALVFVLSKLFLQKSNQKIYKLIKLCLPMLVVFIVMIFLYPAQFFMRSGGDGRLEQRSLNDRVIFFEQGRDLIAQNWLLGVGTGNYMEALSVEHEASPDWTFQPVHNVLILLWAELGIMGASLGLILLIIGLIMAWQKTQFGVELIVATLPAMIVDHWLWSLHFGLLLIGFIVGLTIKFSNYENRN